MTKKFENRVKKEMTVDTKKYRYYMSASPIRA